MFTGGDRTGACILTNRAVMSRRPDRHAASLPTTVVKKGDEALAVQRASVFVR
jgi:hypothetical protein